MLFLRKQVIINIFCKVSVNVVQTFMCFSCQKINLWNMQFPSDARKSASLNLAVDKFTNGNASTQIFKDQALNVCPPCCESLSLWNCKYITKTRVRAAQEEQRTGISLPKLDPKQQLCCSNWDGEGFFSLNFFNSYTCLRGAQHPPKPFIYFN